MALTDLDSLSHGPWQVILHLLEDYTGLDLHLTGLESFPVKIKGRQEARLIPPMLNDGWALSSLLSLLMMCFSLMTKSMIVNLTSFQQHISVLITGQISLCFSAQAVAAEAQFRPSLLSPWESLVESDVPVS